MTMIKSCCCCWGLWGMLGDLRGSLWSSGADRTHYPSSLLVPNFLRPCGEISACFSADANSKNFFKFKSNSSEIHGSKFQPE